MTRSAPVPGRRWSDASVALSALGQGAVSGALTAPAVRGELPGPRSAELLARQDKQESNARTYPRHLPIAIAEAFGPFVRDLDGNVFIDFLTGAGVLGLGHNHPELVRVAAEQLARHTHGLDFPTPAKDEFVQAQLSMLPFGMRDRMKVHFCGPTGANAVDAAMKLCKTATGRGDIVSFQGGFHGSSHAAMAVTGLVEQKSPVPNGVPGIHFFPYSYCARCPVGLKPDTCETNCVTYLERSLTDSNGGVPLPAAVLLELVQGEGGVIPARRSFVRRVRALTRALDIPLIVDEVQTGCGRTGSWFAFEQYDIEPDVIVASKALSGIGAPVAVIIYDERLDVWTPGAHTGTFRGNQLAFAAGAETVRIVRRENVLGNVRERGDQIAHRLAALREHPWVREVRGIGLMWGVEFADPTDDRPAGSMARAVQAAALRRGLILECGGRDDCVVRMLPPLNVTADVVDTACTILIDTIGARPADVRAAAVDGDDRPTSARSRESAGGQRLMWRDMGHRVDACEVDAVVGSGGPTTLHDVLVCPGYDHAVRWRPGERLEQLFEDRCDWMRDTGRGGHLAVDSAAVALTYDQLDARANQLARHLLTGGARAGDRIAVLFDEPVHAYVAMLAVLKINAAYVPLDVGFPADRLSYITRDAGVRLVLSLSHLRGHLETVDAAVLCLDEATAPVGAQPGHRLSAAEKGDPADDLCYVIYTSGSTGRPKGVPIEHASICNFVRVAVEVYGIEWHDRVYQGMTLAFDFAVEETWVPLVAGGTLVPKPGGSSLLGPELRKFLHAHRVSALCCVPTLLATVDEDLPGLRFLLVSGEACPQDLIARWHKPGRRFLNVYGPTEATVTATWTPVHPDKPVTIGVPLPTYSVVILDPDQSRALPRGQTGEIGIAGVGLATGYLNRADLTERAFIHDFLDIPGNPSGRIYRTGDLGRVNENGEIEYHGRIDTQVKIRGYRIELTEIESVLLQVPGIAQAVVDTHCPEPGIVDLVGYYSLRPDTTRPDPEHVYQHLRARLPGYMVPAYLEPLTAIPTMPSGKADRKNLPAPSGPRSLASHHAYTAPTTPTEATLAELLAAALRLDRVSVDSHFFDDLGANSLLIARFCARVRQHGGLPSVATKDVYLHPTIRSLAAALDAALVAAPPASVAPAALAAPPLPTRACTAQYVLCGALQLACFLAYTCLTAVLVVEGFQWIFAASGVVDVYQRSVVFGAATFVGLSAIPILAKWLLVGRWKPQEIPIWSLGYLRFWLVRTLTRFSPLSLFVGSPLYVLYLRALGAKIGRGVLILSRNPPVCTDLLTIGDGTVIRKDAFFTCYRASAGRIQTGRVTLGKDVVVGEATVIEIHTEMGDRAQIGHSSALHAGLTVPAGERWHGSPAQRTNVDYRRVEPAQCGDVRKFFYSSLQLLNRLVLVAPLAIAVVITPLRDVPQLAALLGSGAPAFRHWWFYRDAFVASAILFFGGLLFGLMFVVTVPRVLNLALRPGRVYPLYGFHYWIQRSIARITNAKSLMYLFGDSSFIVYYLRALGYDLSRVQQTGSNFGVEQKHEIPYLTSVGTGTIVSDGLSLINADFSSTSFRVSQASIGARNFLGNNVAYPSGGRTGDNCLLATKVMVPLDGEIREGVGLLGSPCFEIPRSVQRDTSFDHLKTGNELRRRLVGKNRHNAATIAVFLLVRWIFFFGVTLLALSAASLYDGTGVSGVAVALGFILVTLVFGTTYFVLVERAATGFRSLTPKFCSIYEPYFWWHERFWKLIAPYVSVFNGTPFKNLIWRLLGVRIGSRVFDDGCDMVEKTLVTVGSDCTLNARSVLQCHSLEDGTFKSETITVGAGCTLGIGAFVHYGVTIGDGVLIEPDSFVMKGEEIPARARWGGNPARELDVGSAVDPWPSTLPVPAQRQATGAA